MGDVEGTETYRGAMTSVSRAMRRPGIQRGVFSFTNAAPSEFVRSKVSTSEIAHRALTYIPDEALANIPDTETSYSLFQGFQATIPESENGHRKGHRRRASKMKLLGAPGGDIEEDGPPTLAGLKKKRNQTNHQLEMMGIRKNMCGSEIHEIDNKIINFNNMRRIVLDRLAGLEDEEVAMEQSLHALDNEIEEMQEELEEQEAMSKVPPPVDSRPTTPEAEAMDASFMSESIYAQLPSPKSSRKKRPNFKTRKSLPILHEHLESGSKLKSLPFAHSDTITALDFDNPFGTLVTASLDDTVKVWDLNLGRCMGYLEGHTASVRCLQVEDNLVATGGSDATIRLWDLSRASYDPAEHRDAAEASDDGMAFGNESEDAPPPPPNDAMADTPLYTLEAHLDAITALHLRGDTLITGSADKTLRQWDLVKGRCVQTLDVLWAAAQAGGSEAFRSQPRGDGDVPFVGSLQCFDAALACGTADGMVRLWDLRSGQVHRSLVGHTAGVTSLMFDDVRIVTGSVDRSVRVSGSGQMKGGREMTVLMCLIDMGPAHWQHFRRVRLRQPRLEHDVRCAAHCVRGG
jgi:division protein 1